MLIKLPNGEYVSKDHIIFAKVAPNASKTDVYVRMVDGYSHQYAPRQGFTPEEELNLLVSIVNDENND